MKIDLCRAGHEIGDLVIEAVREYQEAADNTDLTPQAVALTQFTLMRGQERLPAWEER